MWTQINMEGNGSQELEKFFLKAAKEIGRQFIHLFSFIDI